MPSKVSPYLLHVNSKPTKVSDELWSQWYTTEHLPDLVKSKTSTRATFYKEVPIPTADKTASPRKFLALYQTDYPECLKTDNYTSGRTTSELFPKEGGTENIQDNGDFDARNYELIQVFDPKGVGNDTPTAQVMTVELYPKDEEDFEKWYREEHLPLLSKISGFRRCLRYKLGPKTPLTKDEDPPTYLAVYDTDDVTKFMGPEAAAANETEWTKKHLSESKVLVGRVWQLVHAEGY